MDIGGTEDERREEKRLLVEQNLRLVPYVARKFGQSGIGLEDLISVGNIGLIKAVNSFDPSKKIRFSTYASRCITNEILMHLRWNSRTRREISLNQLLSESREGNEYRLSDFLGTEADVVSGPLEKEAEVLLLRRAIEGLSGREKSIIRLRFGLGSARGRERTQKEVAELLGLSQSYVSRLEKNVIKRLRSEMAEYE